MAKASDKKPTEQDLLECFALTGAAITDFSALAKEISEKIYGSGTQEAKDCAKAMTDIENDKDVTTLQDKEMIEFARNFVFLATRKGVTLPKAVTTDTASADLATAIGKHFLDNKTPNFNVFLETVRRQLDIPRETLPIFEKHLKSLFMACAKSHNRTKLIEKLKLATMLIFCAIVAIAAVALSAFGLFVFAAGTIGAAATAAISSKDMLKAQIMKVYDHDYGLGKGTRGNIQKLQIVIDTVNKATKGVKVQEGPKPVAVPLTTTKPPARVLSRRFAEREGRHRPGRRSI